MSRRHALQGALGALGLVVFAWWWWSTPLSLTSLQLGLLVPGAAALLCALGLQVLRTTVLFPAVPWRRVIAPVLLAHGLNTVVGLLGDASELAWLCARSGVEPGEATRRLLLRSAGTLFSVGALVVFALSTAWTTAGALTVLAAGALVASRWPGWWSLLLTQCLLATWQALIEALAVQAALAATGASDPVAAAQLGRAAVELATSLPVPLAGIGLHHVALDATLTAASQASSEAVVLHHALTVGVGAAAWAAGSLLWEPPSASS